MTCVLVPILVSVPGRGMRSLLTELSRIQKLPCSGAHRCRPQDSLERWRDLSLQSPRTRFPPGSLARNPGFFFFFFSLHAEQGGTLGLAGFVLLLQGSSWALLQSSPGCFGWFGGKRWRLHHLNQTGGPLVANVGEKLATEGKACPERPARLTAGLLGGPGAPRTALNG